MSIHSIDKVNTIQKVTTQSFGGSQAYWIGFNVNMNNVDQFEWTDGSPDTYHNWGAGQPNTSGNRHCVSAESTGQWITRECTNALPYVCQVNRPQERCVAVNSNYRMKCASIAVTQEECLRMNQCCWDGTMTEFKCYHPYNPAEPTPTMLPDLTPSAAGRVGVSYTFILFIIIQMI